MDFTLAIIFIMYILTIIESIRVYKKQNELIEKMLGILMYTKGMKGNYLIGLNKKIR